jgi:glycerol-3-phosphate dehydrogenase (NAD(P)+)
LIIHKKLKENYTYPKYETVGVIGAGSFGMTIAKLLAINVETVLLYSRTEETVRQINEMHRWKGIDLEHNIIGTSDLKEVAERCVLIFPVIPSKAFRSLMQKMADYLKPYHLLIHGTKGLDSGYLYNEDLLSGRMNVHTMSEVIRQETSVVRIGCLSGPNLSSEILKGQPAATVIASHFKEVIFSGKNVLRGDRFQVFSTSDTIGAELAGALKNTVAIGAGLLGGLGMGYNIWALLITKGLSEMIHIGKAMGANLEPFLGIAGIGDLVATASSSKSRNYSVGYSLAKGKTMKEIEEEQDYELAEGVGTVKIVNQLCEHYKVNAPITKMIYKVLHEDFELERAINFLMTYRYSKDVDYL